MGRKLSVRRLSYFVGEMSVLPLQIIVLQTHHRLMKTAGCCLTRYTSTASFINWVCDKTFYTLLKVTRKKTRPFEYTVCRIQWHSSIVLRIVAEEVIGVVRNDRTDTREGEGGPEFEYRPECGLEIRFPWLFSLSSSECCVIAEKQAVTASPKYWSTRYWWSSLTPFDEVAHL